MTASVKHVSFLKSSGLKVTTSVGLKKNMLLRIEDMSILISVRIFRQVLVQLESAYWVSRNNSMCRGANKYRFITN